MKNCKLKLIAAAVMMSLGTMGSVYAADTSSSMRGKITGPAGQVAANVKIKVKHLPTGTVSEFITNNTGTFIAKGLRVGGPYNITIDSDEFADASLNDVFLQLGDTYRLNRQLEATSVERIAVSASRIVETTGSTSTFGQELIENMPSINRDMKDIARLHPLASLRAGGDLTFAGANPRGNSISVDGIGQNDDFGLNYGGYPTEQPPISLDAIAQISVSVVPFSVTKGGFSGGSINAVTKSGDNDLHGSFYYEVTDPDLRGDGKFISQNFDGGPVLDDDFHRTYTLEESESSNTVKTLGFTLGGPIIKDELFFFMNYENWSNALDLGLGDDPLAQYDITQAEFDEFNQILSDVYGMSDSLFGDPKHTDEKWLFKFDWNISEDQRLAVTYQIQDNEEFRNFSSGGSSINMASSVYVYHTQSSNIALKLYSDWTDNFNSQFGITYKNVEAASEFKSNFGSVTVSTEDRGPSVEFGTDPFRQANASENQNLKITFDANYLMGEHDINFGFEVERLNLYNLFAPNSKGVWSFDTFEDFKNQNLGNGSFSYGNAFTNNSADTAYDNVRFNTVLYAEDTFYLTDDIEVSAGARYESISTDDKPTLNTRFVDTYGISNQENLDGLSVFMPRVSIKWFATDDLTVRGGIGRFSGGVPNVWYNGPFTTDGITYVSAPSSAVNDYYANNPVDITQVPQSIQDSLLQGAGSTNYTDPDFVLPSDWRAQIGVDFTLDIPMIGDGFAWTTELTYMKKKDEPIWLDTSRSPLDENGSVNYAADGERIIMSSIYSDPDFADNFDIMLSNADVDGRSIIFTTSLSNEWDNGISMSMSYANQDVTEVTGGTNSRNQSNYHNTLTVNRNQPLVDRGYYEIEHSFKLNLGYKTEFFDGYTTRFNLFYERHSGRPMSWTMGFYEDTDLGDQDGPNFDRFSPYLPYIPSGPDDPNVDWANSISFSEMNAIFQRAGVNPCGCILGRNTATQPWVTNLDLSIKQDIPGFMDGHKGVLTFTIQNLANLLNDDWGLERSARFPKPLYDFGGLSDDGKYKIERSFNGYDVRNYAGINNPSAWQIKLGLRYTF
jgi:outer membrane receptor for ferrienterochelin and colicin